MAKRNKTERYSVFDNPSEDLKNALKTFNPYKEREMRERVARGLHHHYAAIAAKLGDTSLDVAAYYLAGSDARAHVEVAARFG